MEHRGPRFIGYGVVMSLVFSFLFLFLLILRTVLIQYGVDPQRLASKEKERCMQALRKFLRTV